MKDAFYFPHDTSARNDEKIIWIQQSIGLDGVAIYWYLIEMLYESGGFLQLNYENLAFNMRLHSDRIPTIKRVIEESGLFKINGQRVANRRVTETLENIKSKSDKARKSAKIRWKPDQANAMPTQCEGNAKEYSIEEYNIEKNRKDILTIKNNLKSKFAIPK